MKLFDNKRLAIFLSVTVIAVSLFIGFYVAEFQQADVRCSAGFYGSACDTRLGSLLTLLTIFDVIILTVIWKKYSGY